MSVLKWLLPLVLVGTVGEVSAFADADQDGLPDEWEQQFGLDMYLASDATGNNDNDAFDNLTEFLHGGSPLKADAGKQPDYMVYWDGLLNEWWDKSPTASWMTHDRLSGVALEEVLQDLTSTAQVYSGNFALAMEPARWRYLNLIHSNLDISYYEHLEFYIHGGSTGGQNLKVALVGSTYAGEIQQTAVYVNDYIEGGAVLANGWRKVSIPLATLLPDSQVISRINIGWPNTGAQTLYYLDEITLTAPINSAVDTSIEVDLAQVIGSIPKDLLGSNGGHWVTNMHNDTLVERVVHSGISTMRYPGGNESDRFHWQDWNHSGVADWVTTPDEFFEFLGLSASQGVITTNFGTGTAQEAADWVAYAHAQQADVPMWEIGNEIYGSWQPSWTHDGAQYMNGNGSHEGANVYCQMMKAQDANIKVGFVGTKTASEYQSFGTKAVNNASDCFDYYSLHYYALSPGNIDYHALLAAPVSDLPIISNNVKTLLASNTNTEHVEIAMTEYNSYTSAPEILAKQAVNMLYLADMIGQAAQNGISRANHWFLGGVPGNGSNENYGALIEYLLYTRQPSYYVFPLWNKMGDELLAVETDADRARELSVYASRHSDSGNLSFLVINKSPQAHRLKFKLGEFTNDGNAYAFEAAASSLNSESITYNGYQDPTELLALLPPMQAKVKRKRVVYKVEPYSITVVRFEPGTEEG